VFVVVYSVDNEHPVIVNPKALPPPAGG